MIHNKLKKFQNMNGQLEALGVLDENGQLDVDIAAEMAKGAIPAEGWKIELPNTGGIKLPTFTFTAEDIDVLRRYIEGVSK